MRHARRRLTPVPGAHTYVGIRAPPRASATANRTAPIAGSTSRSRGCPRGTTSATRLVEVRQQRRHHAKRAAGQHERKLRAAHLQLLGDRPRGQRQLPAASATISRATASPSSTEACTRRRAGDQAAPRIVIVDLVHQHRGVRDAEMREHARRERRGRPAAVRLPHHAPGSPAAPSTSRCPRRPGCSPSRRRVPRVPARCGRSKSIRSRQSTRCPGPSPAPASSAISASFTTSTGALLPMRRMMLRMIAASSARSTPAMPRQMTAGARTAPPSPAPSPRAGPSRPRARQATRRFAPGPRAEPRT